MQFRFLLPSFVLMLILLFPSGCTYIGPHAVTYTNQYGNPEGEVAEGEACSKRLFGIFIWGDSSEEAALADARISNAEDISHLTFSRKISQYLIYSKTCTIVKAHMSTGLRSAARSYKTGIANEVRQPVKVVISGASADLSKQDSIQSSSQRTLEASMNGERKQPGIQSTSSESLSFNAVSDTTCQKRCSYVVQYFMKTATLTRDQRKILMSSCNEKCDRSADFSKCMMANEVIDENNIRACWAIAE